MARGAGARALATRRARRRVASLVTVVLVASGLGYVAVASDGTTVHETDLNDAGVFVSSAAQAKFAKANVPIGQLDTGVATDAGTGAGLDVLQDGASVFGLRTDTGELFPIDVRTSTAGDSVATVPAVRATPGRWTPRPVVLAGGTLALLDPAGGKVYAQRVDPEAGTDNLPGLATGAKPVATVGKNGALAVGLDGVIHVVSGADGRVTSVAPAATGFGAPSVVPTALRAAIPDITAVGGTWVAYDAAKDRVYSAAKPDGIDAQVTVDGARFAALQQPGPDADTVVVQSADRAAQVPLDGGASPGGVVVGERVNRVPGAVLLSRPVVLGGCVHAAWAEQERVFYGANCGRVGDEQSTTLPADGKLPTRDGVALRVNRGLVVLNDLDNGGVWDLEDKPTKIDNWDALTPPVQQDDKTKKKDENLLDESAAQQPPTAKDDTETVRPGRTSKLHVLDNDTDAAGSVLAIDQRDVTAPSMKGVVATVSADGQAIDVSVPADTDGQGFDFSYKVNNGTKTSQKSAKVTVRVVGDDVNGPPRLRPGGAKLAQQVYPVIVGKRLSVPVLADWRDPENDVLAARAETEGGVVDGQGRITLRAPTEIGRQQVGYLVTDGLGGSTEGTVSALVIGTGPDAKLMAPRTQPDAVRGVVGKPLQVEPLGNDVAGADPGDPDATLKLRSDVRPVGPLQVDTDLATGQVTITGSAPGTYELSYSAVTGAGAAAGRIRVDLVAAPAGAPPVSVPDTATLHDQSATLVDVLANDYSPRGDVLVTASVQADGENSWLQPSIYQGRWVRLESKEPAPLDGPGRKGVVRYTVSDGTQRVTGQVAVLQQPALDGPVPLVVDDEATVREGDTVSIPVLDNDTMADGIPLVLKPGSVKVISQGDQQRAFASGNVIRYVPEARGLKAEKFVTIEYAAYAEGMQDRAQTARVRVQVTPLPNAQRINQAPVARSFTATVTAGDPLTMTVPTFGVDADGDSVTVTGVVGADGGAVDLTLGRVVGIGPSTIRYESFPLAAGTEVITYEVRDRFGATSRASVRVGVVQPGDPQPPVAVADEVFAAPGKTVTVKPLTNDLVARGDSVEVETNSLNPPAVLRLWRVDDDNVVQTKVPDDTTQLHQLGYSISNGIFDPSKASILVRPVKGWVNPPVANDDVAAPKPGETATLVDALANDTDVDSDPATLQVVQVLSPDATYDAATRRVSVRILDHPYSVPYVIKDEDGATAMALIHVPTGANGQPFVVQNGLIEMDPDSSETVALNDYVKSPRGRVVSVTTADTVSASPAANLSVSVSDNKTLQLTSSNGYVGPAAVMLEVTDQDAVGQKDFGTAYVSVPVQIGPKVPLLRCPDGEVSVLAGGIDRSIDLPTFCHAWLPVGTSLDSVRFETRWETEADADLRVDGPSNRRVTLHADAGAASSRGRLSVTAPGLATPSTIGVRVIGRDEAARSGLTPGGADDPVPAPRMRPISLTGLQEGQSRSVDVSAYLDSPLADPACAIASARIERGTGVTVKTSGCTLTVTVGTQPSPTASIALSVSDGPGRTAPGRVSVTMLGRPSVPRQVGAVADRDAGGQARVSWLPPTYDGGATVSSYVVRWTGGSSGQSTCSASPCTVTGLTNGKDYRFTVAAVNGVGEGPPSAPSAAVRPDTLPRQVTGVRMVAQGDRSLQIGWDEPSNEGSALTKYVVRLISSTGQTKTVDVPASSLRTTVTGLDNMAEQSVQVQAWNELGAGPFGPAVTMQSAGTPPALPAPDIQASGPGPAQDSATLSITWEQGSPNGPPTTKYTLYQSVNNGAYAAVATTDPGTRFAKVTIPYDGNTYRYSVTLTNGAGLEGPQTNSSSFTSIGQPSTPTVRASTPNDDRRITLTVGVGQPRAGSFTTIRWSGGGQSGSHACGCTPGSQVSFAVGPFDTSPTNNRTITVWTVNSGAQESTRVSDTATPYGPALKPTGLSSTRSGNTITWDWNLPENGRPIQRVQVRGAVDQTFESARTRVSFTGQDGRTYQLEVRSFAGGSWSPWAGPDSQSIPDPKTVTVLKGSTCGERSCNTGNGSCTSAGCRWIAVRTSGFSGGVNCTFRLDGGTVSGWRDMSMGGNATKESDNFYGGTGRVTATCGGVSDSLNW